MAVPAVGTRKEPAPFELPDIPKGFAEDNGEFYSRYDALAEELDNNMVKGLKEQLDGLLIFAGLFAGVNSTFLALTLPLLSADPVDDTNALLRENNAIILHLALNRNDSLPLVNALPSETFSVSGRALTVNILFSISLTFALMSSLFAVLGRQWLIDYLSHSGSGADNQRRVRINRYLGARRWQLVWLLGDMLPTILQVGLILFGVSLTIYLSTLHSALCKIVGAFMGGGIAFLVFTAIFAIWDPFCPFQTPFSRMITSSIRVAFLLIVMTVESIATTAGFLAAMLLSPIGVIALWIGLAIHLIFVKRRQWSYEIQRQAYFDFLERSDRFAARFFVVYSRKTPLFSRSGGQVGAALTTLQVEAVGRVICYSDDLAVLMSGISNLLAIEDRHVLWRLARDHRFCHSLTRLCNTSYTETLHLQGPDHAELATAVTWRYRAAIAHVAFSGPFGFNWLSAGWIHRSFGIDDEPGLAIPSDLTKASPQASALTDAYLGYTALLSAQDYRVRPSLGRMVTTEFEGLIDSSWKRISMIIACIDLTCKASLFDEPGLYDAYIGKPSTVLRNFRSLLKECNDPTCDAHTTFKKYLVDIFKFTGKATIDSSGQSTIEIDLIAKLLCLSEVFLRTKECPAEFSPVARGLRRDLISVLHLKCDMNDTGRGNDGLRKTVITLSTLFSDLMAVGKRPTISSNDDDLELVHLFTPVLQRLDEVLLGHRSRLRVMGLCTQFVNFTTAAEKIAQIIKSRDRDPEFRWCHWQEE